MVQASDALLTMILTFLSQINRFFSSFPFLLDTSPFLPPELAPLESLSAILSFREVSTVLLNNSYKMHFIFQMRTRKDRFSLPITVRLSEIPPDMFCAAEIVVVEDSGGVAVAVARSVASASERASDGCSEALSERLLPLESSE